MREAPFVKMHGLGNDFVIIDARGQKKPDYERYAKSLLDRKHGIGGDQLLVLTDSKKAPALMNVYNNDGSVAEMCGNGLRCIAALLKKKGKIKSKNIQIDTLSGLKLVAIHSDNDIEAFIGKPEFEPSKIPVKSDKEIINSKRSFAGLRCNVSCVSVGNPHCVVLGDKLSLTHVLGPVIEKAPMFPKRTNVEFVKVLNRKSIQVRIWERGAGETRACGSGAVASMAVLRKMRLVDDCVRVRMQGGDLIVRWDGKNPASIRGSVSFVFEGTIDLDAF